MGPSKPPTAVERKWLEAVSRYGCCACRKEGHYFEACHVHHIVSGFRRMGHLFSIGLCPIHHTGTDKCRPSVHGAKRSFVKRYGSELELLAELQLAIGVYDATRKDIL